MPCDHPMDHPYSIPFQREYVTIAISSVVRKSPQVAQTRYLVDLAISAVGRDSFTPVVFYRRSSLFPPMIVILQRSQRVLLRASSGLDAEDDLIQHLTCLRLGADVA